MAEGALIPTIDRQRNLVAFAAPKTGSTFVKRTMGRFGGERFCGHHDSYGSHQWAGRGPWAAFGTIRNPWDWYPSWYVHAQSASPRKPHTEGYGETFKDALRVACAPDAYMQLSRPGIFFDFDPAPGQGVLGLCSAVADSVYWLHSPSGDGVQTLIATDRLNEGLSKVMGRRIEGRFDNTHHQRDNTESVWPRPADHYADWYDDEMVDWVRQADAALIERFGFEPFTPSPQALYRNEP